MTDFTGVYWRIRTNAWEDEAFSEKARDRLIQEAKRHCLNFTCTKHRIHRKREILISTEFDHYS